MRSSVSSSCTDSSSAHQGVSPSRICCENHTARLSSPLASQHRRLVATTARAGGGTS